VEQREPGERIEGFLRRYGSEAEGNRVLRVLGVAVAILLVLRVLRMLAIPLLIGAILLVGGWLLLGPPNPSAVIPPIPKPDVDGLVDNGVAVIVACGKKRGWQVVDSAPELRTGTWGVERRGACNVYYHHPPDAIQRANRHERAQEERIGAD
jgi:hypothetical protein